MSNFINQVVLVALKSILRPLSASIVLVTSVVTISQVASVNERHREELRQKQRRHVHRDQKSFTKDGFHNRGSYRDVILENYSDCHQSLLGKLMGSVITFKFSQSEAQLDALSYMVSEETKSLKRLQLLESSYVCEPLIHFLTFANDRYQREYRSKALLILAAVASDSKRAIDFIHKFANDVTLTGLARVKNVSPDIFKTTESTLSRKHSSNKVNNEFEHASLKKLRILLASLDSSDQCMDYILTDTRKKLKDYRALKKREHEFQYAMIDDNLRLPSTPIDSVLFSKSIQSIALLSTLGKNCDLILENGGLNLLLTVLQSPPKKYSPEQIRRDKIEIARIIANVATRENLCASLIHSPYMQLLVQWVSDEDIVLQAEASRALINLENNTLHVAFHNLNRATKHRLKKQRKSTPIYKDGIYILYPSFSSHFIRTQQKQELSSSATQLITNQLLQSEQTVSLESELSNQIKKAMVPTVNDGEEKIIKSKLDFLKKSMKPTPDQDNNKEIISENQSKEQVVNKVDVEEFDPNEHLFKEPIIDVVFVHGLLGGAFFTWRSIPSSSVIIKNSNDKNSSNSNNKSSYDDNISLDVDLNNYNNQKLRKENRKKDRKENDSDSDDEVRSDLRSKANRKNDNDNKISSDSSDDVSGSREKDQSSNSSNAEKGPSAQLERKNSNVNYEDLTQCWPKFWLPKAIPDIRVISLEYDTQVSDWASVCPALPQTARTRTLRRRAQVLLAKLREAGIGTNPVVFVTHSMGGLVVKSVLVQAAGSLDDADKRLVENTKGVVFLATPHFGSHLADYFLSKLRYIVFPSVEVDELSETSVYLKRLHHRFSKLNHIKCLSLGEKTATKFNWAISSIVVSSQSANPKIGTYEEYDVDHLEICKPVAKTDPRYLRVLSFIETIVEETKKETNEKKNKTKRI